MARRTNLLRQPLNAVLASEGHVRVLRELVAHGGELAAPELALRTGLTAQGVRNALAALVRSGVVEAVGLGRYLQYRINARNALVPPLKSLFAAEQERFQGLLDAIRAAAAEAHPRPKAVWLYGSVARREDRPGSDVDVAVVFAREPVEPAAAAFREALSEVAEGMGIELSVAGLSDADVLRLSEGDAWWEGLRRDARPLVGADPDRYARLLSRDVREEAL